MLEGLGDEIPVSLMPVDGTFPFRYNPEMRRVGENAFRLDSPRPSVPLKEYMYNELRFRALIFTRPADAEELLRQAQAGVAEKYRLYEGLAALQPHPPAACPAQRLPQ